MHTLVSPVGPLEMVSDVKEVLCTRSNAGKELSELSEIWYGNLDGPANSFVCQCFMWYLRETEHLALQ